MVSVEHERVRCRTLAGMAVLSMELGNGTAGMEHVTMNVIGQYLACCVQRQDLLDDLPR